jgi:hypothetical protein
MDSNDEESDIAEDNDNDDRSYQKTNDHLSIMPNTARPTVSVRFVSRLAGRHSHSKMNCNNELQSKVMAILSNKS